MTETPPEITTSDLVRGAMAMRGYVQRDLARVLGRAQNSVSEKLSSGYDWRLSELVKVSNWLGIDIATLAGPASDIASLAANTDQTAEVPA